MKTNENSFRLKASVIKDAGVGVFALHDIDKNQWLALKPRGKKGIGVLKTKNEIPENLLDYCIKQADGKYLCPPEFNHMHIVWYLNHSNNPNAELKEDGYYSTRDIKADEEILIDYKLFHEPNTEKAFLNK